MFANNEIYILNSSLEMRNWKRLPNLVCSDMRKEFQNISLSYHYVLYWQLKTKQNNDVRRETQISTQFNNIPKYSCSSCFKDKKYIVLDISYNLTMSITFISNIKDDLLILIFKAMGYYLTAYFSLYFLSHFHFPNSFFHSLKN